MRIPICFLLALNLVAFAEAPAGAPSAKPALTAQEPPEGQDPIIGEWSKDAGTPLILGADGTITGGRHGTWHYQGIVEGGRHYELRWNPPKNWSDWVNISEDGKLLEGHSRGKPISYYRKTEAVAEASKSGSPPPATPASANPRPSEILAQQAPNAMEWALAPLDEKVPGDIRQNVTLLREDLRDEAAKNPVKTPAAYKLAEQLCDDLINAMNDRDVARVRAGYTAAQANVNMGEVTNQALDARRHNPNWPSYRRENAQREELRKQKENGAALENQRPVIEWFNRSVQLRASLSALYTEFREAGRKPSAAP